MVISGHSNEKFSMSSVIDPNTARSDQSAAVIADTTRWLERAVIGLNLCPFAKAVHVKGQIRYVVSDAMTPEALANELQRELEFLAEASAESVDTTLLIHPQVLTDFLDFNDFLEVADGIVDELELHQPLAVSDSAFTAGRQRRASRSGVSRRTRDCRSKHRNAGKIGA